MALIMCFESQKMIIVLLLGACISIGLSYDEVDYGETYRIRLPWSAQSLRFHPKYTLNAFTLWNRDGSLASQDGRQEVVGSYFEISNVTQKDSGDYKFIAKNLNWLYTRTLKVKAKEMSFARKPGEYLKFNFDLEPNSCNIYFFPKGQPEVLIVSNGQLLYSYGEHDCEGFELLLPCGISNEALQMSCNGRFEVKDQNDNTALMLVLKMEPTPSSFDTTYIGIGFGVFFSIVSCCCCARRCYKYISCSEKDESESPDAEPAEYYHEYDHEPAGPRRDELGQPSETLYPALPSYTKTGPQIHHPPTYSEVSAPAEPSDAPTASDAPTSPLSSNPEPRFEFSFPSAPPLNSDSTYSHVYTSDKLNF
uniref:uncharacterized protein n=1 Tax=Semicossyphus pulcher TaxID=241346 RepID=UPI0037E944FC